ncbi:MAG TPA: hypothetical protein VGT04_02850 [Acidobacteriaceae bacterium]|nr:hypothetical protein [Acidobacteriaceae bacterium]
MSTTPIELSESATSPKSESLRARSLLSASSFVFAVLQSICGAAVLLNGFQLAVGIGALTFTSGIGLVMARLHADWIRVPMILVAVITALLNIALLVRVNRLRNRPAAQWRRKPLSRKQKRSEALQWTFSIVALVLVGIEEYLHMGFHHTL